MSSGSKAGPAKAPMPSAGSEARGGGCRAERRVVEVGPEHRLGRGQQLVRQRRLAPAHHLGVEPGRLHRIGPRRAVAPDQQIAVARRAWCRRARPSGGRRACGGSLPARRRCGPARPGARATSSRLAASSTKSAARACARTSAASTSGLSSAQSRAHRQHLLGGALQDLRDEMQDVRRCRDRPRPNSTARRRRSASTCSLARLSTM